MNQVSRRAFLTTSGAAASAVLTAADVAAEAAGTAALLRAPALTLTCANYVRFMPIATGDVRPKDLALTWVRGERNEMLRRATEAPGVDGGETSMAQHVQRLDRGDRSLVAIPIFPLRNFTARDLYVRRGAQIAADSLGGRRLGIYNWAASGAVWYRHLLRYFGNDTKRITWVVGGVDAQAAVRLPDPPLPYVRPAPDGSSLSALLIAGDIDAAFAPLPPRALHPADGPLVRAFPNFAAMEQKYFADSGCFPPQHVLVIRRASWDRDRSVGRRLVEAFNESEAAFEALQRQFPYNSPWLIEEVEGAARLSGTTYHAHGFDKNQRAVDVFCQAAFDDGLTARRVTAEELFSDFLQT
jgi:4,5-dihydroxyphthalate decarboxylase